MSTLVEVSYEGGPLDGLTKSVTLQRPTDHPGHSVIRRTDLHSSDPAGGWHWYLPRQDLADGELRWIYQHWPAVCGDRDQDGRLT